jgi:hypothetical protein
MTGSSQRDLARETARALICISFLCVFLSAASLFAQQDAPLPELPVLEAYYPLSSNALNQVGNGATNNGVVIGAVFQDQALFLNGDSCVNFGSSFNATGSLSLCWWMKPQIEDRLLRIIGKLQVEEQKRQYCLFLNNGNRLFVFMSGDDSADRAFLKTTVIPVAPSNEWHNFAATWDSTQGARGVSIYADGQPQILGDIQSADIHSLSGSDVDLTLGAYDIPPDPETLLTNSFCGSISQLVLFRGVLSPSEVYDLYEQGRFGSLMAYLSTYLPDPSTSLRTGAQPNNEGQTVTQNAAASQETTTASSNQVSVLRRPPSVLRPRFIYVDQARGNDACSGRASLILGSDGPKKTVKSGLSAATAGDTLVIKEGNYGEDLNIAGRNMSVRIEGKVNLSGHKPAEITPLPAIPASNVSSNGMGQ